MAQESQCSHEQFSLCNCVYVYCGSHCVCNVGVGFIFMKQCILSQ